MQRVCKSARRNLRKKVRRKDESNTVRADERERETKLEGPTSVYLLTAQLKVCCLEKILDNGGEEEKGALLRFGSTGQRQNEGAASRRKKKKTASPLILIM